MTGDRGLRMEMLLKRSADNRGVGYLARLARFRVSNSDLWYWQGVCDGLNYTNPQFAAHCKRLLRALRKQ
ncbi:MAG: hypothetical protein P8013_02920 [Candidatus Sulfobium sp.]|jgi:hypothetical protein